MKSLFSVLMVLFCRNFEKKFPKSLTPSSTVNGRSIVTGSISHSTHETFDTRRGLEPGSHIRVSRKVPRLKG